MHDADWFRASPILQNIHIRSMICGRKVTSELMEQTLGMQLPGPLLRSFVELDTSCQSSCMAFKQLTIVCNLSKHVKTKRCIQGKGGSWIQVTICQGLWSSPFSFMFYLSALEVLECHSFRSDSGLPPLQSGRCAHGQLPTNIHQSLRWLSWHGDLWKEVAMCGSSNSNNNNNNNNWLVVSTPLKNISQWEGLSHILWKIKNVWNHQPDNQFSYLQKIRQGFATFEIFEIVRMHHVRGARDGAACKISDTTASFSTGDKLQVPWVQLLTQESEFQWLSGG